MYNNNALPFANPLTCCTPTGLNPYVTVGAFSLPQQAPIGFNPAISYPLNQLPWNLQWNQSPLGQTQFVQPQYLPQITPQFIPNTFGQNVMPTTAFAQTRSNVLPTQFVTQYIPHVAPQYVPQAPFSFGTNIAANYAGQALTSSFIPQAYMPQTFLPQALIQQGIVQNTLGYEMNAPLSAYAASWLPQSFSVERSFATPAGMLSTYANPYFGYPTQLSGQTSLFSFTPGFTGPALVSPFTQQVVPTGFGATNFQTGIPSSLVH